MPLRNLSGSVPAQLLPGHLPTDEQNQHVSGGWRVGSVCSPHLTTPWPCPHLSYSLITHLSWVHTGMPRVPWTQSS